MDSETEVDEGLSKTERVEWVVKTEYDDSTVDETIQESLIRAKRYADYQTKLCIKHNRDWKFTIVKRTITEEVVS